MTGYFRSVDIGNLHLEGNVFAAPMSGYTDRVTRGLALFEGAVLAYTEMISAEALIRNSGRTLSMMNRADGEGAISGGRRAGSFGKSRRHVRYFW